MTVSLLQYAEQKRAEAGERAIPSGISRRWRERIVANGWLELGEDGAANYLERYGQNIGAPKVVHFARQAESEGCPEMALGFWRKAYELELGRTPPDPEPVGQKPEAGTGGTRAGKARPAPAGPSRPGLGLEKLPAELAQTFRATFGPFLGNLEATIRPYIEIWDQPGEEPPLWHSKFGGRPYLPQGSPYPTSPKGRPLSLLAQLNFAQVPSLEPFPRDGILQFYVAEDGLHGMNYDDPLAQDGFRVLYVPHVVEDDRDLITDWSFLPATGPLASARPRSLTFKRRHAPISVGDYRFESAVFGKERLPSEEELRAMQEIHERIFASTGDKIGGHPFFAAAHDRYDPRRKEARQEEEYGILLLQTADTWFGSGTGTLRFFIREKDLRQRDFSRVLYYCDWDID